MIYLTREVRFSVVDGGSRQPVTNSWGGWPSASGISPWLVFRCTLAGEVDPISGYLCNIKLIDDALRGKVISNLPALVEGEIESYESLLFYAFDQVRNEFPENCHLRQLQVVVSPTLNYTLQSSDKTMIQVTQQFEFSASHRLHNPDLTEEQNRKLYGKCNNPHGHGHNYVVMVTLEGIPDLGRLVALEDFECLVKKLVIDRMDHRNLNVELDEFRDTNPSVENIARVVWDLLSSEVASLSKNKVGLSRVRVYETPKTWADYFGVVD